MRKKSEPKILSMSSEGNICLVFTAYKESTTVWLGETTRKFDKKLKGYI